MHEAIFLLKTERDTRALGAALGDVLDVGDVVFLIGPLGVGKTTLARAAVQRRCDVTAVPSPTFTLVETYPGPDLAVWHFDFYRLEKPDDAWELGVEEAFAEGASLIEWPEHAAVYPADQSLRISLSQTSSGRQAVISAPSAWEDRLVKIADALANSGLKNQSRQTP